MKKSVIAKSVGVFFLVLAPFASISCKKNKETGTPAPAAEKSTVTLATEIGTVLQGGEFNEKSFRSLMEDIEWIEIRKAVEIEADSSGLDPKSIDVIKLKSDLSLLHHKMEMEQSRERQSEIMKDIKKELHEMAEEEGLKPR